MTARDFTATYRGNANGAYVAGSDSSYFTGDVRLTAEFKNPTGTGADGSGSIQGAVTNIVAGGQSMAGSIELQKHTFRDTIEAAFGDDAVGVVDDKSFSGDWKGQFFGYRYSGSTMIDSETDTTTTPGTTTITRREMKTFKPQAPGSVAGTFYATQQSNPAGSAAFIGAFGATPITTRVPPARAGRARRQASPFGLIGGVHLWRTSRSSNRTFSRTGTPEVHDSLVPFLSAQEIKGS